LPREKLRLIGIHNFTGVSNEIFTRKFGRFQFLARHVRKRILAHRSALRIIVWTIWVEIVEIFGGVLSNTEIAHGNSSSGIHIHALFGNHVISILVLIVLLTISASFLKSFLDLNG
jgi:hypothetical protein